MRYKVKLKKFNWCIYDNNLKCCFGSEITKHSFIVFKYKKDAMEVCDYLNTREEAKNSKSEKDQNNS